VKLYKDAVTRTGGWLTENGIVNLQRVKLIMDKLGDVEDEIFKTRHNREVHFHIFVTLYFVQLKFREDRKYRKEQDRRQKEFQQRGKMSFSAPNIHQLQGDLRPLRPDEHAAQNRNAVDTRNEAANAREIFATYLQLQINSCYI
jgi:5'-3' exonuclease